MLPARHTSEAPEHERSLNKIRRPSIISTPANSVARALSLSASARRIAPGVRLIGSRSKILTPRPSNVRLRRIGENKVLASQKSHRASPQGQHDENANGDVIGDEHGIVPPRRLRQITYLMGIFPHHAPPRMYKIAHSSAATSDFCCRDDRDHSLRLHFHVMACRAAPVGASSAATDIRSALSANQRGSRSPALAAVMMCLARIMRPASAYSSAT
jgi:hypothetical protein